MIMILACWISGKEILEMGYFGVVVKGKMINLAEILRPQVEEYVDKGYDIDDLTIYEDENEEFEIVSINEIKDIKLDCPSFKDWIRKTTRTTIEELKKSEVWVNMMSRLEKEYNELLEVGYLPIELTFHKDKGKPAEVLPVYAVHNIKVEWR